MAVNNFHFKLDIEREDHIPKFQLKQFDTAIFYATLYRNGLPYHFENEKIKMFVKKNDGTIVYQEDEIVIQDDEIKINVKNQALTASGLTYAELELQSSTGQVTTATFVFEVKEKVGSDDAVESVTDISTLEKVDKYVEEAKKELDKFKNTLTPLQDLVANKDKLEGQNTEAKVNIKELEKVLDQANNIVSDEGKKVIGNNVVSESTNGYVQYVKLKGKTLVNLLNNPFDTSKYILNGANTCYYNDNLLGKLKIGESYTILMYNLPSNVDSTITAISGVNNDSRIYGVNGVFTFTVTSLRYSGLHAIHLYGSDFIKSDFASTKLVILEGDHTQNPPQFFEGMKNVGDGVDEIEINSCNSNLFDNSKYFNANNSVFEFNNYKQIPLRVGKPNQKVWVSSKLKKDGLNSGLYYLITNTRGSNTNWEGIVHSSVSYGFGRIIEYTSDSYGYIYISISATNPTIENMNKLISEYIDYIVISTNKLEINEYIPHEQSKRNLLYYDPVTKSWKKPILREWDTIEKHSNGKYYYYKKSFEEKLDENKHWILDATLTNTIRCFFRDSKFMDSKVISDTVKYVGDYNLDEEHIYTSKGQLWLFLSKQKSADLYNFKDYLRRFPITVIYQLAQAEIYECLDISVRSFRDTTMLSVSSGSVDPGVEYYIPTGFVSADNSICEKVDIIDNTVSNIYEDLEFNGISESMFNNNMQTWDAGQGLVDTGGSYVTKDYRNQMKSSLITLNNIYGATKTAKGKKFWNVNLSNIATYNPADVVDILSQPVFNNSATIYDVTNGVLSVRSVDGSFGNVQYAIDVLPDSDYMISFDVTEDTGMSWVAVAVSGDYSANNVLVDIADGKTSSIINPGGVSKLYIRFYSNVGIGGADKVTRYSNVKLIKVKDYCKSDLVLRGLPNGVRDYLVDGKVIRRVKRHVLTGYEGWSLIDTTKPNTNVFLCKLPESVDVVDKAKVCLNATTFDAVADDELYQGDKICFSMGGGRGQLVFAVGKWCKTVDQLIEYISKTEPGMVIEYESSPRTDNNIKSYGQVEEVAPTLLAEKGDKVILGSPILPVECHHKVQLSTRAQVEELQKDNQRNKKSMWNKLKRLFDGAFSCDSYSGYLRLPSLLGGFILQWGYREMGTSQYNYLVQDYTYPIAFPTVCYYTGIGYMRSGNSWQDLSGNAVGVGNQGKDMIRLHIRNTTSNNLEGNVSASWIAFGR